jgi:hypothetical protein
VGCPLKIPSLLERPHQSKYVLCRRESSSSIYTPETIKGGFSAHAQKSPTNSSTAGSHSGMRSQSCGRDPPILEAFPPIQPLAGTPRAPRFGGPVHRARQILPGRGKQPSQLRCTSPVHDRLPINLWPTTNAQPQTARVLATSLFLLDEAMSAERWSTKPPRPSWTCRRLCIARHWILGKLPPVSNPVLKAESINSVSTAFMSFPANGLRRFRNLFHLRP